MSMTPSDAAKLNRQVLNAAAVQAAADFVARNWEPEQPKPIEVEKWTAEVRRVAELLMQRIAS